MMAGWKANGNKFIPRGSEGNEMVAADLKKPSFELMQNCDLPPPQKVFTGVDKTVLKTKNKVYTMIVEGDVNSEFHFPTNGFEDEKLELLKAVQLSQTRAREAERKAATLARNKEIISKALFKESLNSYAYRQMVRLLELQVSKLQSEQQQEGEPVCRSYCYSGQARGVSKKNNSNDEGAGSMPLFVALALCLGIAGVGFALGYKYLL